METTSNPIMSFILYILSEDVWEKPNNLAYDENYMFNFK